MKNLNLLIAYLAVTATTVQGALSDGFQTKDLLPIGLQLAQLPDVQKVLPLAKQEWENRTDEQIEATKAQFKESFDLENEDLEVKIEKLFAWVASTVDLVGVFTKAA